MDQLHQWLGDTALTNILLAATLVQGRKLLPELRGLFPYVRALVAHFKVTIEPAPSPVAARAKTEPGE